MAEPDPQDDAEQSRFDTDDIRRLAQAAESELDAALTAMDAGDEQDAEKHARIGRWLASDVVDALDGGDN